MIARVLIADPQDRVMQHLTTFLSWSASSGSARSNFVSFFGQTGSADDAVCLAESYDGHFVVGTVGDGDWSDASVVTRRQPLRNARTRPRRIVLFGTRWWLIDDGLRESTPVVSIKRPSIRATASHAVSMLDLATRRLDRTSRIALATLARRKPDGYCWAGELPRPMDDACVGLLGAGEVGLEVARILRSRVGRLHYWSRTRLPRTVETALDLHWSSTADDLFECCDAVSIHTVDAEVVSAKRLQDPGRCRVLVNTARTSAWDEAAVIEAARRGRLSVGTDCVESKAWADESLRDRVIVTPHVAGDSLMRVAREFESVAIACLEPAGSNQSHILGGENLEV